MKEKFKILGRFKDEDGTEKFVFKVLHGIIELTWIKNKNGIAVFCLPTHHYCNLGCKFCHLTGKGANIKMVPISAESLIAALKWIIDSYINDGKLLFCFMGVGEPFLNINLVFQIYDYFKKNTDRIISLALASMMLAPAPFERILEKVKQENLPLKIHFSLHSPSDKTRKEIIPSAPTTISECLKKLKNYQDIVLTNQTIIKNLSQFHKQPDPVEIHYTVIDGINDGDEDLSKIIEIGNEYKIPLKILKFNPTESLKRSPRTEFWFNELSKNYGAPVYLYAPPGPNIGSSCGQFTKHYYLGSNSPEELKEFKAWKKKYEIAA
jgi:adenine C2-methylase RlmN of 23S rRNA A2503 and tRNA A37